MAKQPKSERVVQFENAANNLIKQMKLLMKDGGGNSDILFNKESSEAADLQTAANTLAVVVAQFAQFLGVLVATRAKQAISGTVSGLRRKGVKSVRLLNNQGQFHDVKVTD